MLDIRRPAAVSPRHAVRTVALCMVAAALAGGARAATLNVPATFPTVREAVAAAVTGDTILVAPGVHAGGVWINGKSLTIASTYAVTGDTTAIAQTTLSGVAPGACGGAPGCVGNAVLEFGDNAHGSAVVGLTIANGENGIASASLLDVRHCRVLANGDGVDYVVGAGGSIRNCLFDNNADDGIDLNGKMDLVIRDNEIRNSHDDGIEFRLYAYTGAPKQVDIIGNRITGNGEDGVQLIDYPGAGDYVLRIERNLFQSNFNATGLSAAIACTPNGETVEGLVGTPMTKRMVVIHNTFIAEKNGVVGGANAILLNNVFTDIEATAVRRVGGNSIAAYSLFWNNGINYYESAVDTAHQISAAPLLDAAGIPTPTSPAINAGTAFYQWRGETVLNVSATTYSGSAPDLGAFETNFNMAPQVNAGPDRIVILAADIVEVGRQDILAAPARAPWVGSATLLGAVSDDGLPYPPALAVLWSVVSGPGAVFLSDPRIPTPVASFSVPGTYFLRLTADDGLLSSWDLVKVTVRPPGNGIPVVDAGGPQTIHLPDTAFLQGEVVDDGLPDPPGSVTLGWTKVSGPGPVTFENPAVGSTRAALTTIGTYVLRLSASDGEFTVADSVTVTVEPVRNQAPVVIAGPDQTIMIPSDATLAGVVSDDGQPDPPAAVATSWSVVSGPGPVTFANVALIDTQAGFTVAGVYLLRLAANDGAVTAADTMMVTVQPPPPATERRIAAGSDDAEERSDGHMVRKTAGLDMVYDSGNQVVGLRFTSVPIPTGARIIGAWIQFEADGVQSDPASLLIQGQLTANPPTFTYADFNLSSRPRTDALASWSPPPWTVVGEAGPAQRTSDLTSVVQELVAQPAWASGNAMAFIITGTGRRSARTFEAHPAGAALLHVEYGGLPSQTSAGPSGLTAAPGRLEPSLESVAGEGSRIAPEAAIGREATPLASAPLAFAIVGLSPQPSRGVLRVELTLADDGPAFLELMDVAGRRVEWRRLATSGPGRYAIELNRRLPAGIYLVRLTQGPRAVTKKAVVLE